MEYCDDCGELREVNTYGICEDCHVDREAEEREDQYVLDDDDLFV